MHDDNEIYFIHQPLIVSIAHGIIVCFAFNNFLEHDHHFKND